MGGYFVRSFVGCILLDAYDVCPSTTQCKTTTGECSAPRTLIIA